MPVNIAGADGDNVVHVSFDLPSLLNVSSSQEPSFWTVLLNAASAGVTAVIVVASNEIDLELDSNMTLGETVHVSFAGDPEVKYEPDCELAPFADATGVVGP